MNDGIIVTPDHVVQRLLALSKELDEATSAVVDAERQYADARSAYDVRSAQRRIIVAERLADKGIKATVQEKDDMALLESRDQYTAYNIADGQRHAARHNVNRIRAQIELARSIGTLVRTAVES